MNLAFDSLSLEKIYCLYLITYSDQGLEINNSDKFIWLKYSL